MLINFLILLIYALSLLFFITPLTHFLFFVLGLIFGAGFVWFDQFVLFTKYDGEQSNNNSKLEDLDNSQFNQNQSNRTNKTPHYISHSLLFLLVYAGMAVYLVTSGGNRLAQGIVMGLGLTLWLKMFLLAKQTALFKQQFLWQLKTEVDQQIIWRIMIGFAGFLLFLTAKIL